MSVTAITRDFANDPNIVRLEASNTLAQVAAAGYLTAQAVNIAVLNSGTWTWQPATDMVLVAASDGLGFFTVNAGATALVPFVFSTTVIGAPVVVGDFAVFGSTSGNIEDLGYLPSNAAKTRVVMANSSTTAGQLAAFVDTTGTIGVSQSNVTNSATTASATPGTIRALVGAMHSTNATMTSGNLVGVRGEVDGVGASGGFWYGTQGKIVATGTLSGSLWAAGIFGQLDVSAATINAGQVAALWGDWGATGAVATDLTGCSGIKFTNTTANKLNEQINTYGDATYYLNIRGNPGPLSYYLAAGTSAGSAGDAAHCAAQQVLKVVIQGADAFIPVFTQNT